MTRYDREILSYEKAKLENEKIQLEIKKLKRQPELKIQLWNLIITTIIALITLYSLKFLSSLYDIKSESLGLRKEKLDREIIQFQSKRDSLLISVNFLQDSLAKINFIKNEEIKRLSLEFKQKEEKLSKIAISGNAEMLQLYKAQLDSLKRIVSSKKSQDASKDLPNILKINAPDPGSKKYQEILDLIPSIKKKMEADNFELIKESPLTFETGFEMPIIVSLTEGTWYQFIFVGETNSSIDMRLYNWDDREVYQKNVTLKNETEEISFSYIPKFSEYHMLKIVQNTKGKNSSGYIMLYKKRSG